MKLATTRDNRIALIEDGVVWPLHLEGTPEMGALIARYGVSFADLDQAVRRAVSAQVAPGAVGLGPVVPRPGKIIGIGRNYGAHAKEGGLAAQERPRIFFKPGCSVSGHGDTVLRPPLVRKLDFEGELVAVIGTEISGASPSEAARAIFGYTIGNDLSAREFQFDVDPPQTSFAKGMTGFAAIGPMIVTADVLGSAPDLDLRTLVNGVEMQHARTSDLIFPIADCLSYVSQYMDLHPGDLLFTGTPAGVGAFLRPPVFLQPGDIVRVEVERIGALETRIG